MANPVMHFELIARDRAKLRGFYGKLFGWREQDYPDAEYTILQSGAGMGIDFAIGSSMAGLASGPTIYVAVDDVGTMLGAARKEAGVEVVQEPYEIPGMGQFAVFTDPEGNRIGLWKMPEAS